MEKKESNNICWFSWLVDFPHQTFCGTTIILNPQYPIYPTTPLKDKETTKIKIKISFLISIVKVFVPNSFGVK